MSSSNPEPRKTPGSSVATPLGTDTIETAFGIGVAALSAWQTIHESWLAVALSQLEGSRTLMQSLAAVSLHLDGAQATLSQYFTAASRTSATMSDLAARALGSARSDLAA